MFIPSRHIRCGHDKLCQSEKLSRHQLAVAFDITDQCTDDMRLAGCQMLPDLRQQPLRTGNLSGMPPVLPAVRIIPIILDLVPAEQSL